MTYQITNQRDLRAAFWQGFTVRPKRYRNGDYPVGIRMEWVDFIDHLVRDGIISEALAARATL